MRIEAGFTPLIPLVLIPAADATVTYGATGNIAIQASVGTDINKRHYAQGAVGLYKNVQNSRVTEIYTGFRSAYTNDADFKSRSYSNYQVYFIQFNRGNITKRTANTEYGFGLRAGLLHAKESAPFGYTDKSDTDLHLNDIIIEPVVFLRLGGKKLKFQTELSVCKQFRVNHTDTERDVWPVNFGLGISYSL